MPRAPPFIPAEKCRDVHRQPFRCGHPGRLLRRRRSGLACARLRDTVGPRFDGDTGPARRGIGRPPRGTRFERLTRRTRVDPLRRRAVPDGGPARSIG